MVKVPPNAPDNTPPRRSSHPLPPYRFIPGINAHPVRDPQGHSYGEVHEKLAFIEPAAWRKNDEYLFGVDLYNHAYWWESHEAWENVWHTTDKQAPYGQFLQGLIQISAAFIKWHLHQHEGMKKLFDIGIGRLEFVAGAHEVFMGVAVARHVQAVKNHFQSVLTAPSDWPDPLIGYPFLILEKTS